MPYLDRDITSAHGLPIASRGAKVEVIRDRIDMVIVRDEDGNQFGCRKEYLVEEDPLVKAEEVEVEEETKPGIKNTDKKQGGKGKVKLEPPAEQMSIF